MKSVIGEGVSGVSIQTVLLLFVCSCFTKHLIFLQLKLECAEEMIDKFIGSL